MEEDIRSIGPRIRMMRPSLTDKEQQIVDYLLKLGGQIQDLTITQIADHEQVSEAMVVKLAKKLGFSGYRDIRRMLYEYSQLPVAEMYEELDPEDTAETIVHKVFQTAVQALHETEAILNIADIERAADTILNSRNRDFYGVGGSATIARDAGHKFMRIGVRCTTYEDAHLMAMSASLLSEGDMVLAISHSGETSAVLDAVRLARQNGASVIGLTNYSTSTLAAEADISLFSTARGSAIMGENAAARIAQLNILDALFVRVAQRDYNRALDDLNKTMASVKQKRETNR